MSVAMGMTQLVSFFFGMCISVFFDIFCCTLRESSALLRFSVE